MSAIIAAAHATANLNHGALPNDGEAQDLNLALSC